MIQRILFVCLGNICRSPLVEEVARQRFAEARLAIDVASCGTGGWHVGAGADGRMRKAAAAAGYQLDNHRGRQLSVDDFTHYDLLLAMDSSNLRDMRRLAPHAFERTALFLDWAGVGPMLEFPDPYYGGQSGFVESVKLAERGVAGLIERLRRS
jgi:protein-tyrosine phosphatase